MDTTNATFSFSIGLLIRPNIHNGGQATPWTQLTLLSLVISLLLRPNIHNGGQTILWTQLRLLSLVISLLLRPNIHNGGQTILWTQLRLLSLVISLLLRPSIHSGGQVYRRHRLCYFLSFTIFYSRTPLFIVIISKATQHSLAFSVYCQA